MSSTMERLIWSACSNIIWITFVVSHNCFEYTLPVIPKSRHVWCEEGHYAIYECMPEYMGDQNIHNIVWCDNVTKSWFLPGKVTCSAIMDPCHPNPCMNYGMCSTVDDPYGWGFSCTCYGDVGGKLCEIEYPCNAHPCPPYTRHCIPTSNSAKGRRCYNINWKPLD